MTGAAREALIERLEVEAREAPGRYRRKVAALAVLGFLVLGGAVVLSLGFSVGLVVVLWAVSPLLLAKLVNVLGAQGWYYQQMDRIGDGHPVDTQRGLLRAFARYYFDEFSRALRMRRDV